MAGTHPSGKPLIRLPAARNPTTRAQTANHDNSTSPSSASLSNTAAGYTTLGGRWQFAAVAGAATDYALFAFQVPRGFRLFVSYVALDTVVTGAAIGATATIMDWSLGINSTAVSLATASLRRIPIGLQSFVSGAAIGSTIRVHTPTFDPELTVEQDEFVHMILQIPVGLATINQVIRGVVHIHGFFEPI